MVSKHSMESDTNIRKLKVRKALQWFKRRERQHGSQRLIIFSPLTRVIFLSHLFGLMILILGSLTLNQYTQGLITARIGNLQSHLALIGSALADTATGYDEHAMLDEERARSVIRRINMPEKWRIRLYSLDQKLIADSEQLSDDISVMPLDPVKPPGQMAVPPEKGFKQTIEEKLHKVYHNLPWRVQQRETYRRDHADEVRLALDGRFFGFERFNDDDHIIVSVGQPVMRVQHILGAVILESQDVQDIIAEERRSLMPFIGLAILASMISSVALTMSIVLPLRHLSSVAEKVAHSRDETNTIPDYSWRRDEIGDLSVVLRNMTKGLYSRIDDVANFAADVAHEIKNPLTSLRSASDTLKSAKTKEQTQKLVAIIQDDVQRMDRLISDISKASRLDASLARETAEVLNVHNILSHVTELYQQTRPKPGVDIMYEQFNSVFETPILIKGFEIPFAQVLRNLVDNALTFSSDGGTVTLRLKTQNENNAKRAVIYVEDEGPGIPPDNVETIFERFYTERPKGTQFGSHSGLGLAICRQIVTAHHGFIFAENREKDGHILGARFVVNLPIFEPR